MVDFIIWLIIGTIILGLIIFLATWIFSSKQKAKDKLVMGFIVALIAILVIPIISGWIATGLNWIGSLISSITGEPHFMGGLVAIVEFLLFLVVLKVLMSEDWGDALWITLISLFILYILYSFIPVLYTYINTII